MLPVPYNCTNNTFTVALFTYNCSYSSFAVKPSVTLDETVKPGSELNCTLTITYITPDPKPMKSGSSVTFVCSVTAKPKASVEWTHLEASNKSSPLYKKLNSTDCSTNKQNCTDDGQCVTCRAVTISNSTINDNGCYMCTAYNGCDVARQFVDLSVLGKQSCIATACCVFV